MPKRFLRYADLEERGLFRNRVTLRNWITRYGFPVGRLIGPNTRVWTEAEIEAWLARRPTVRKGQPAVHKASTEVSVAK
jgi:predicted DNA-binding transcriptional regulator AlpA